MKHAHKQAVGIIVAAAVVAGVASYAYLRTCGCKGKDHQAATQAAPAQAVPAQTPAAANVAPQAAPSAAPAGVPIAMASAQPTPAVAAVTPALMASATSAPAGSIDAQLQQGRSLLQAGKLLAARDLLSGLFFSGTLSAAQEQQAVQDLTMLAEMTIFNPRIVGDDPYAMQYTIRSGDNLIAVERRLALHMPTQILVKINNLGSAAALRAGATLKLIQGPVHAVVSKSRFAMDLYLQRDNGSRVFLIRLPVGLGTDGSTPLGSFQVELGKKLQNATWNPPPSSGKTGVYKPGEPDYPLGKGGYWISLVGTEPATAACKGYGIHGTNQPDSIGKNASLGCIRLDDHNIELVFSLLYEKWSTVTIVP